ncbi:MAG: zinc ribbon domain-containing protein [Desulfobacterales bacterium]
MPIYEINCKSCGFSGEVLVFNHSSPLVCPTCGASGPKKLMSATSSSTGRTPQSYPGPSDTTCCGNRPSEAGCAGPGSCCGKS